MIVVALALTALVASSHHDRRLAQRICTWQIERLADLPEFRRGGASRANRMVWAADEQANDCDPTPEEQGNAWRLICDNPDNVGREVDQFCHRIGR